jgi:type I restriction enzyme S subunit
VKKKWPKVRLGDLLRRSEETIEPEPDAEYREITVRLWGKGVVERGRVTGGSLSGRRFIARSRQFICSRIDARNGAMGLVPPSLDGALVTNDFPLFALDETTLLPEFLGWFCRTRDFVELCLRASEGTTNRVRLKEERFLNLEVALPPLAEQGRVVAWIEELAAQIHGALTLRHQAAEEAEAIVQATIAEQFAEGQKLNWRKLRFGDSEILRIIDGDRGKNYPQKADFAESGHCLFLNTGNVRRGVFSFSRCEFISQEKDAALRKGKLARGDVILTTRGTLGNSAHYDSTVPYGNMRINSGMVILRPTREVLLPQYLQVVLNSPAFDEQVSVTLSGSAQSQLPINKLSRMEFLLPPLPEQRRIVSELDVLQAEVDVLKRLQAETAIELDALVPAVLDRAFKGEL